VVAPSGAVPRVKAKRGQQLQLPPTEDDTDGATNAQPVKAAVQTQTKKPHVVIEAKKDPRVTAPVPAFRVNGIAFQPNEADSMAIVNGTPVSRGSVIEGATVAEIQKDRILFQRNGEKFEVQLGQSNK
jgi:type II secretory pathway component PulC